ncbi:2-oxoglutarate and iron-dependent oxygenase domain-containing protein 3 [Neodiprion lecontei]|uniref:2-oxoglutarate and iron-dependent oxygenase domain-containing protein 3 n=1 Tax=Neodiprion lecontei TaxID=441921 RepID=A0A6J0BP58_NEOLC|nr:2-oxoglutarate and iron-dependent oxygenase domain-containing protein 3 [Neodiprion lecontei]XP_046419393.1 2-oxoglutarate and iron-dependent oxygenase domain-containing protein 3-like [Neodiprion fabricii]
MTQEVRKVKRKDAKKAKAENESKVVETTKKVDQQIDSNVKPKYGPIVTFPYQRVWSRCILILGVLFVVWYNSKNGKEISLAQQKDVLLSRNQVVECSDDYKTDLDTFPNCTPQKCSRVVTDKLVSTTEVDVLLRIAKSGFSFGGSAGGASILDLHSGALSKGSGMINIYTLNAAREIFNSVDLAIYKAVRTKIQHTVAHNFGIDANNIYLTHPTFFSRMTNEPAKTIHDEYWHPHVDKETYKSFYYTSLVYLNDFGKDFEGGRFVFIDKNNVNMTVEPRKGRVSLFTSGSENLHQVEKVTSGTRYALTVSFTCNPEYSISDPAFQSAKKKT